MSVVVIYKDYDGKIKRGVARNKWEAFGLYHTFIDPGILVPTRSGMSRLISGPRQTILYMFNTSSTDLQKKFEEKFGML